MTDNQFKIRIQIPQSSQPKDDATHHSIPDIPGEREDTEKAPFDMQKISITLFVIFLTISSFVYLVFIDETEPAPTVAEVAEVAEQPIITNDSMLAPPAEILLQAPIEQVEHLSEPLLVEEEAITNINSQSIESEVFEAPIVIDEHSISESAESIVEIVEVDESILEVTESLTGNFPGDQSQVIQAQLTSAIEHREPVDEIDHITLNQGASIRIHFFMRLRDLAGQQVSVRWFYQNNEVAKLDLPIGNNEQWRTHANKLLPKTRLGQWHVELHDASGNLLAQRNFTVSNNL